MKYVLGIDIGGTSVKIGLFYDNGELIDKGEMKTRKEDGGAHILSDIRDFFEEILVDKSLTRDLFLGAGVGVPGPVKSEGIVQGCVNLGWDIKDIKQELEELLGIEVKVANDANIAALGEAWKGSGSNNMVMVTLGTGVGGGIVIDSRIVNGFDGLGGEIGHMTVNRKEDTPCNCGRCGCLEQYTSATGIVNMSKKYLANSQKDSKLREIENITAKDIFDLAKEGDELAIDIVDEFGDILGFALSQIASICNPEVFVIGGGVSKAGEFLIDSIRKHYVKNAFHKSKETQFTIASLGNDAGIYGGARLILQ